ncbi:DUF4855 domain-containing protein [Sporosarcina sp. BP05]|uniref:DUF4855 domain-containing protein n=1 Tax=Sporosarcina sp. BP05 TaxID=2758726 RepID=UPI00164622D7|nr:DUF4855 domain-containing protein [Sporosarcina sp. BP05]
MKSLKLILLLLLCMNLFTPQAGAQAFKDVPTDHWAHDEIRFLTDKQVIRGFSDGNFKPLTTLTRKDAAVMIVRALKLPAVKTPTVRPTDLMPTMGGYTEMMIAAKQGMFTISNNKFQPGSPLTREEMARVLAVAYDYKGSGKSTFKDLAKSNPYYKFIDAIATNGVTTGYSDGTFKPEIAVNRAQFSTFLKRVYEQPHSYTVKQDGKVLQEFRSAEEAIALAVKNPGATVHPKSNSLMKYGSKPAALSATGIKNGVLIYNGAEGLDFSSEFFGPYLTNGTTALFDTFVVLGRTYTGGEFAETAKNKANYKEWKWYADTTFSKGGALHELNRAAANEKRKVQVYIAIPYPKRNEAIIKLDGTKTANKLQTREEMVNWYISTVEAKWKKENFSNLTMKGYYWLNETVIHAEDEQLVTSTAKKIHGLNKKFIFAPHALSTNFENWQYYGFDGAYLQPNSFRLSLGDPTARLHKAFLQAQIKGSGITLEIDTYSPHQMEAGLKNFEKYLEIANLYGLKNQSLLFYQGTDMVHRMGSYTQAPYQEAYRGLVELLR